MLLRWEIFTECRKKNEHKQVNFLEENSYSVRKWTLIPDRGRLMIEYMYYFDFI